MTTQSRSNRNQSTVFATSTTLQTKAVHVAEAKSNIVTRKPVKNYLNADQRILRFNIVEIESKNNSAVTITGSATPKTYGLLFYLSDDTMEVRLLSKTAKDEATVLIKKQPIPKNYSELDSFNRGNEIYFEATDLICGKTLDLYGRKFLILTCDAPTRLYYQEIHVEQPEIVVEPASSTALRAPSKESRGIDDSAVASLQIGERERNQIRNPNPNFKGITLRCKCRMITGDRNPSTNDSQPQRPHSAQNFRRGHATQSFRQQEVLSNQPKSGQWFQPEAPSRLLLLTYYFEDLTLAINEEDAQNSLHSGTGKSFLRRNRYQKDSSGSYFDENDIYLGNTITLNGFSMKIVEMDESSSRYCEDHSDSVNFLYFNIDLIADRLLDKVSLLLVPI